MPSCEIAATMRWQHVVCAAVVAVATGILLAGCAGGPGQQPSAPTPRPSPSGATSPAGAPGDPDLALCQAYLAASGDARAPLSPMRTEKVLVPTVDFIELGANQIATRGTGTRSDPSEFRPAGYDAI